MDIPESNIELVAMSLRSDLAVVGSLEHCTLLDPRKRGDALVNTLHTPDAGRGVRSIAIKDHVLSFATGNGKIVFYDLRAQEYLPVSPSEGAPAAAPLAEHQDLWVNEEKEPHPEAPKEFLQTGEGTLERNITYWDHFSYRTVRHACYAHVWDPSGTRLLACGGPLAFGLGGSYLALWE